MHIGPLDAHACLSWWVMLFLVVFCAACLVLECIRTSSHFGFTEVKFHFIQSYNPHKSYRKTGYQLKTILTKFNDNLN
jgi:hypothetical protein